MPTRLLQFGNKVFEWLVKTEGISTQAANFECHHWNLFTSEMNTVLLKKHPTQNAKLEYIFKTAVNDNNNNDNRSTWCYYKVWSSLPSKHLRNIVNNFLECWYWILSSNIVPSFISYQVSISPYYGMVYAQLKVFIDFVNLSSSEVHALTASCSYLKSDISYSNCCQCFEIKQIFGKFCMLLIRWLSAHEEYKSWSGKKIAWSGCDMKNKFLGP